MNKTGLRLVLVGLGLMVSVATGPVRAEEKAPSAKEAKPAEGVADDQVDPNVLVLVDNARRLRTMMSEKMNLSTQQAAEIDRTFDVYVNEVLLNGRPAKPGAAVVRNKILAPTYQQMSEDLKSEEALGDATKVATLKRDMANRRMEPIFPTEEQSDRLLAKVKEHLQADQVAGLEKIVARWQAISPGVPYSFPLDRLRRALNDPDAELSTEVKAEVTGRLQAALKAIRLNEDKSLGAREAEVEKARIDIFAKLSSDQQKKVEATLGYLKETEKGYTPFESLLAGLPTRAALVGPPDAAVKPNANDTSASNLLKPTTTNEAKPAAPNDAKPAESKP